MPTPPDAPIRSRGFKNIDGDEAAILRWLAREGFEMTYMSATEDHDPGDEEWDRSAVSSGDMEEIIRLAGRVYGKWHIRAVYHGAEVQIDKPYPSVCFGLTFRYPEAAEPKLGPVLGRFRSRFTAPPKPSPAPPAPKPAPKREKPANCAGGDAVRRVAGRLSPNMREIPVEKLFPPPDPGDTFRDVNAVFYHPDFAARPEAWMAMKSKWRRDRYSCVVMTDQTEDWARQVSKRLNARLPDHRIVFLRPVEYTAAPDFEQPRTVARWYAPLEKRYYRCVMKWEGYGHDGSEDHYSLRLYRE